MSVITLMDDSKTLAQIVSDTSDGLGIIGCTKAEVTEELNGMFILEFNVSILEKHFDQLHVGGIVRAKPNDFADEQLFRIHDMTKPMMGIVGVEARHISYDLLGVAVKPFKATGVANALTGLVNNELGSYPFTVWTDLTNTQTQFQMDIPMSFRNALGGVEGSILDQFGGEYEWNNTQVRLHAQRGLNRGVTIEYGKNLIDANQEENIESQYNAVLPYAVATDPNQKNAQKCYVGDLVQALQTDSPKTLVYDFSDQFESDETPTNSKLQSLAVAYIAKQKLNSPKVNITVKFVPLSKTEEYKNIANLEKVALGDTVTVYFERFGISTSTRIVKTVYNVLADRYESVQLGDVKASLGKTISGMNKAMSAALAKSQTSMEKAVKHATDLISGGLGGHVVIGTNDQGQPNEILIMDNEDKAQAQNVLRMNLNGIGFSKNGYVGPYDTAWTLDGAFVANFITTGSLSADRIKGGTIDATNINVVNINGQNIQGKTIGSSQLDDGSAIERVIGGSAVTEGKIGSLAVTEGKIGGGAVTNGKIGNSAVSYGKTSFQGTLDQVGTNKSNIATINGYFTGNANFYNINVQHYFDFQGERVGKQYIETGAGWGLTVLAVQS